jgi:hypothetical protein
MKTSSKRTKIKHLLNSVGYGVAICLPTVVGAGHASALTGGGTIGDPYTISTCTDLQDINTDPTAYYILVTDIDCSDTVTWNSGDGFTPIGGFSGTLDGQEHTVSGLSINNLASIGIFADVEDGTIKNLTIDGDGASITGDNGSGVLIGTMIGGTISHVTINEDIVAGSGWGGGIVGHAICNSPGSGILMAYTSYSGTLTQAGSLGYGGLVGYIEGNDPDCPITISNSHTSGTVSYPYGGDAGIYAGGLVGEAYTIASPITITASSSSMDVTNADSEIGGLVGFAFRDGSGFISIHGSSASGNITAKPTGHNTGGLVGEMYGDGEIYQSYAAGNVTAGSNVGGLVGIIGTDDISIHDVYATGAVSGDDSVGGLIGVLGSSGGTGATLARSYASGNVTGNTNVGGLVGGLYGAVSYSFATGAVDGTDAASTGGLFGYYNPSFFASSTGNAFDVASTGQTDCYGGGCDSGSMMSINTANYFVHTSTKPPLNHWDFTDVWQTTTDLPLLREEVLGGMTVGATAGTTQMEIHWTAPTGDQTPNDFDVQYSPNDTTWIDVTVPSSSTRSVVATGLQPGTTYYFRIRFTNDFGTSDWLEFLHATLASTPVITSSVSGQKTVVSKTTIGSNSDSLDTASDIPVDAIVLMQQNNLGTVSGNESTQSGAPSDNHSQHSAVWQYAGALLVLGGLAYTLSLVRHRLHSR